MGVRQLEANILRELKEVSKNKKLRQKDIMEWRTGKNLKTQEGEELFYLPKMGISVAVKITQ